MLWASSSQLGEGPLGGILGVWPMFYFIHCQNYQLEWQAVENIPPSRPNSVLKLNQVLSNIKHYITICSYIYIYSKCYITNNCSTIIETICSHTVDISCLNRPLFFLSGPMHYSQRNKTKMLEISKRKGEKKFLRLSLHRDQHQTLMESIVLYQNIVDKEVFTSISVGEKAR